MSTTGTSVGKVSGPNNVDPNPKTSLMFTDKDNDFATKIKMKSQMMLEKRKAQMRRN